jgi:hypothetical protein
MTAPLPHDDLVHRYIAVWNLPDDSRRAAIDDLFTEDVLYVDPEVSIRGRAALDAYIALTRRRFPGLEFSSPGRPDGHHEQVRFVWQCAAAGGDPALTGLDFALLADGRVAALHGFFDPAPVIRPA